MTRRDTIMATIDGIVADFLYYDRKEDEDLPRGAIDDAVRASEISIDEMVAEFDRLLRKGLKAV